jgi:hypothetical protein
MLEVEQAGLTLAAGLGVAVASTATAQASVSFRCCPSSTKCGTCSGGYKFLCYNSTACQFCTACRSGSSACYNTTAPACP